MIKSCLDPYFRSNNGNSWYENNSNSKSIQQQRELTGINTKGGMDPRDYLIKDFDNSADHSPLNGGGGSWLSQKPPLTFLS